MPAPGDADVAEILLVDDDQRNLDSMEVALGEFGRRVVKARSGADALRRLLEKDFALILLDIHMPGMDGFETAQLIRQRPCSKHIPIIFVTAYRRDDADTLRGYALGAVDFLFKPIVPEVLRAKAWAFVELQRRTAEVRRQGERLRELERLELEGKLAAERQRWEAEVLRQENQRMDQFLAVLAHELRNPLAPLVTGLELIARHRIEHAGLERIRGSMERQVHVLVRLVDDLVDVARISQGKVALRIARVSLASVAAQALEVARPVIEAKGHELQVEPASEPVSLVADDVRLTQVIANLLNNAARHTDAGGTIRLSWGLDGEQAVVRVADDGHGVAPEMRDRIFEMFVQEGGGDTGLGLGLTLVRQLVSLHGGTVQVLSAGRGQGSEFVVRLPLGDAASLEGTGDRPRARELAAPADGADGMGGAGGEGGRLRVALVEDDPDVRQAVRDLLEGWGHQVAVAEDGLQGLELILARRPDVAFVDIAMPELDGHAVARKVRRALGDASPHLVAITGFGREEDRERSRRAGFDDHLVKPASARELDRALREATSWAGP